MKKFLSALVFVVAVMVGSGAHAFNVDLSNPKHYGNQNEDSGWSGTTSSLTLTGNTWAVIALESTFTVKSDSILTFSYESNAMPEIAAIVFDISQSYDASQDKPHAISLGGTDGWPGVAYQMTPPYQAGDGLVTYTIPLDFLGVGNYFNYMVFANDKDSGSGASGYFSNVSITSATPIPGAVWLLGSGLVGLIGLRKKRHQ